jgi:hypothetical protein
MTKFFPLRQIAKNTLYKKNDILVIFGEVFDRGYVNGLIEEAQSAGLRVIYSTVGRRNKENELMPLSVEELALKKQAPIINVPLEAGFDLEKAKNGITPVDQLKEFGLKGWEDARLDWKAIEESRQSGIERFRKNTHLFLSELKKHWQPGQNILFAHTMAGGFPRAKVVMPISNRIFKGSGPRFESSEKFWNTDIGKLCALSFQEVTAHTLTHLIETSAAFRQEVENSGAQVRYLAFGYHGNETLIGNEYKWFSYTPYLQGWAKVELENIAALQTQNGIKTTVFNVPEILTNSSSIFLGIEVALYSLMGALKTTSPNSPKVADILKQCEQKLKEDATYDQVSKLTQEYLSHPEVASIPNYETWPQHNTPKSMELMSHYSEKILGLHKSDKDLLTSVLSEVIFRSTGKVMFHEMTAPRATAAWIGHDLVAKVYCE